MNRNLNELFSKDAMRMKKSAIRELLKLVEDPEIISFAGGLPAPDSFPVQELKEVVAEVMENDAEVALQYGTTEGDKLLRQELIKHYKSQGITDLELENIIITTASQQALFLIAKVFLNEGDKVLVGLPSYLGGLSAFNSQGADLVGVELDENGMRADLLEEKLAEMKEAGELPKFIYIIPDFQNPTGITMPKERRLKILEIAKKYDVLLIEDSPYRELRFEGEHVPTFYELDNDERVLTLGTFSKIFAPGFRIGWILGPNAILDKIVMAKQAVDLCTPPFTQRIVARYLEKGYLNKNIKLIIDMYQNKRRIMLEAFEEFMPECVTWTMPEGGLFLFLNLPEDMDARKLFDIAIKEKVAFVLGEYFHCDGSGKNKLRINFSYAPTDKNKIGVERLAKAVKSLMK